ncbi:ketoacyl-ACP synthase III [Candidatus Kirkpatrickella diaphorinae]|uniref:Beta-ketoacyl-[acyl-carrier-protein] synthase III n=1 Tax=Candidatus Kirkpatrickella diaphorinae TaxID=2984322 RepID=A0ABY6GLM8_9PROT|nr:beta-ketoacyl-ACP synthase III [Candidatus Kirkpatrickella diaphorinae]UYH51713.1 ketoacyl-ACP synthase III [Candidatus Kirkpatrickella diaphorinae]
MPVRSKLIGFGGYLPDKIVTNADLSTRVDTSDEWIRTRTGIAQRHIAGPDDSAASMGEAAARAALEYAGVDAETVDAIIVATATPDQPFPAVATRIQGALGLKQGFAFDISAACSGFIYALAVADSLIQTKQARRVLVIGSEVYSRILDWSDRTTCVLFGDGAGAVLLDIAEPESESVILSTHLHSDGAHADILYVEREGKDGPSLRMNGREVFRHAVTKLAEVVDEALHAHGMTGKDVQWLVPHQANLRIIDGVAKKLALPQERVIVTVDRHANTSAASIPLALNEAVRDGRVKKGEIVLLEALGGGLTWGAALLRL